MKSILMKSQDTVINLSKVLPYYHLEEYHYSTPIILYDKCNIDKNDLYIILKQRAGHL